MNEKLTAAQNAAVECIDGPLMILAGPGSGKTRVVTHRTANMIQQGINPRRILTLTFTNKAADEMQQRLQGLVDTNSVWTSTFHKFCSKTLRNYGRHAGLDENFTIYDTSDSQKALKQAIDEHDIELFKFSESNVLHRISHLKNQLISPAEFQARPGAPLDAIVAKVYPLYQKRLIQSNAVDFDDLLLHVAKLLIESPEIRAELDERYQYIAVDEYQDTNYAQYVILKLLSVDHRNLAVTGDPDQSIYGWRGANIRNILDFEKDFPETRVVRLEQNYRSTPEILSVADYLIEHNSQRKEKRLFTENPQGTPVRLVAYGNQFEEANQIADQIELQITKAKRRPQDIAIFYRTNALSRTLEHSLRTRGIPYQIVKGHEFYQRKEIKDVLAYLHLINNPKNDVAFERIINVPARKIGRVTIDRLKNFAYQNGICLLEAAVNADRISTLKGNAKKNILRFSELMFRLRESATDLVGAIVTRIYQETEYRDILLSTGNPEDEERAANLDELLTAANEFDLDYGDLGGLDQFLDQTSLVSDVDAWETESDRVTLMTLHAAKGLEFPSVYIVALEDGILPHSRSMNTEDEIEEERRLLFVGITRAKEELQLSRSMFRPKKGRPYPTIPSTFLMELPRDTMEVHEPRSTQRYGAYDEFSQDTGYEEPVYEEPAFEDEVPFEVFDTNSTGTTDTGSTGFDNANPDETHFEESKELPNPSGIPHMSPPAPASGIPQLMTADQLLANSDSEASPPIKFPASAFSEDMLVSHPTYGAGRITSISKAGSKKTATVEFVSIGEKKFVLSHSSLRPVQN